MRKRLYGGFIVALTALGLSAGSASALSIIPESSGLDVAVGCLDSSCASFSGPLLYNLSASAPVSGSFGITGTTLGFSIDLAAANLIGPDSEVTSVDFSNVHYVGSVSVVDQGSGQFSIATQSAGISGTLTPNGPGSPVAFDFQALVNPVNISGSCTAAGNTLQCGLIFGSGVAFEVGVNGNQRFFKHNVDITGVVPEPNTALLMGLGLSVLAVSRGRRPAHSR
jgi:hypothetical protein